MAKEHGQCHICGVVGPLTFEHVPPIAAGNEPYGIALDVKHYLETYPDGPIRSMRRKKLVRGSGGYYLCASCNNLTGHWYVNDYAWWAAQGQRFRMRMGDTNSLALPFQIFPGRVFKQILAIFASTCSPRLFEVHPYLRKLVLDPDARGMPNGLRLYAYIVHPESHFSRQSGVAGMVSGTSIHTLAEFAFRPFGYLLTLGGTPPPPEAKLLDITFFGQHGYRDFRELHLPLPVRPVETYFPADFRTKKEWAAVTERVGRGNPLD